MKSRIGNDIVDLCEGCHPRFIEKICSLEESKCVLQASHPKQMLCTFWAIKEAGFKAVQKLRSDLRFNPKSFAVQIDPWRCKFEEFDLHIVVEQTAEFVHAIALSRPAQYVHAIKEKSDKNESIAVRELAQKQLVEMGYNNCAIQNRPPQILRGNELVPSLDISLSHHGRYLASAIAIDKKVLQMISTSR